MLRMVFYTRAHDGLAEDGWDGAVLPSCCTCCLEVNLAAWLSEEIVNHPQPKQLAKSLQGSRSR